MKEHELFGEKVKFLPGLRPVVFNVASMPDSRVKHYRRAFRVNVDKWHSGDYSEVVQELIGMRLIAPREDYVVVRPWAMHDFFDVSVPGADGKLEPAIRLYAASHSESYDELCVREKAEATGG